MITHCSLTAVENEQGVISSYRGIIRDITENKRAEEALKQSEQKHRLLFESAGDAIFIHDTEARILAANASACKLLGYTRDELMSMTVGQVDSPEQARHVPERMARLMGHGHLSFETEHLRKDGSPIPVEVSARVITWDGQPAIMSICRDITERKRAEDERQKLVAQLNQAQKMEYVGRLAGGVAHDFNNMLGVILGHTELALEVVDPASPLYNDLKEIQKAGSRSADLTRQLLAFARKQTVAPKVLDLNEVLEGMLKMLRRLMGEDITLIWSPGSNLWPVRVDPSQIDQVLANLCVNSRDAISGIGRVTIETGKAAIDKDFCAEHEGAAPGEYVILSVSDDGCGMDGKTLEKLFEPFFTTKEVGKGTGLGLATVYGIVQQNNGFIDVRSEPGQGSAFRIYLPRYGGKDRREGEEGFASPALK